MSGPVNAADLHWTERAAPLAPGGGVEFRASDEYGRPVDVSAETPTQRTERIERLQQLRIAAGERMAPPVEPVSVMREWMANPANRQSALAARIAQDPSLMPRAELEPGPGQSPQPGGLIEQMQAEHRQRRGLMERINHTGKMP